LCLGASGDLVSETLPCIARALDQLHGHSKPVFITDTRTPRKKQVRN
jgi:hypothetical protein